MGTQNRRWILTSALTIIIPILLIFIYSNLKIEFKVGKYPVIKSIELRIPRKTVKVSREKWVPSGKPADTTKYKILLMGDSQLELMQKYFSAYCVKNGHNLALTFVYRNSSETDFAYSDSVTQIINSVRPDYIIFVIGLNELFVSDFEKRAEAINALVAKFNGAKYAWVGPANYALDKGINDVFRETVEDGCFFLSKNLVLQRGPDGRHPDDTSSRKWVDTIASWLTYTSRYQIRMMKPDSVWYFRQNFDSVLRKER